MLAACTSPTQLAPIEVIEIRSGEGQSAVAGEALPDPIVARVLREDGSVAAWLLRLHMPGAGELDLGNAQAIGENVMFNSPNRDSTSVTWTLGPEVGEQLLRFFAVDLDGDTIETTVTAQALAPPR